jgi:hypothetical protein
MTIFGGAKSLGSSAKVDPWRGGVIAGRDGCTVVPL